MKFGIRNFTDPVSSKAVEHPTRNGAILLILAVLIGFGAVLHKLPLIDSTSGYTVKADFASVNEVDGRTPVRIRGVDVGMVTGVGAGPDPRRSSQLKMLISRGGFEIHSDATAAIRWRTILGGSMYIDLNPGSPGAPKLTGAIPVSHTSDQVEFDDVLRIYNGNTDQAQRATLKGVAKGLAAPAQTAKSIDALPDLTTVGAGLKPYGGTDPGDLAKLVANTAHTAQALGANVTSLQTLVSGANQTLGAIDDQRVALGRMLALSPGTLNSTLVTMHRIRTTLNHLDPLVDHLEPGSKLIASMSHALQPALNQANSTLHQAQPLLHNARPTLANLKAASAKGTPILTQLEPTIARLNSNILPWLQERDPDTRVINYESIGPTLSVLDKGAAEYDESGYRLHLSTLLGTSSVIDESGLTAGKKQLTSECHQAAKPDQLTNCPAAVSVLLGGLFGGQK